MKPVPTPSPAVHALALAKLPGVGRRRLRTLLSRIGSRRVASSRELADLVREHGADLRWRVSPPPDFDAAWDEATQLAEVCRRHGWRAWVLGTAEYPAPLMRLEDPPALLFVHGTGHPGPMPRVAVIGTREPSSWGERMAADCAHAVVCSGGIVVSGLAWGIDTAAHRAAVAVHGRTWAVLPSALDVVFPPSNAALADRIVETGGALISEYLPGTRPHPTFFVERDRLQAALAQVVVVVETALTGGTMHTVRFARNLNVPLHVAFPPDLDPAVIESAQAVPAPQQGTWSLLRAGAARTTPEDVARLTRELAQRADVDPSVSSGSLAGQSGGGSAGHGRSRGDEAAHSTGHHEAATPPTDAATPSTTGRADHRQGRLFDEGDDR